MNEARETHLDSEEFAKRCVGICEDRKAENVILFDVRETSVLADFYLICSGTSEPHVRALKSRLHHELAADGILPRVEGSLASHWIVMDYGVVLIHILQPELRDYYKIEELWNSEHVIYRSPDVPDER